MIVQESTPLYQGALMFQQEEAPPYHGALLQQEIAPPYHGALTLWQVVSSKAVY